MNGDKGFTIIEMLVAVTIFTLVFGAATGVFVSSLRAQRQSLAYQELLDQTSYLMEYMSRAIRMAKKDDIEIGGVSLNCLSGDKVNYEFSGQCLKFRNYKNECQQFCLNDTRLKETKAGDENYLTAEDLNVENFNVTLDGETQTDNFQPTVAISLEIEGKEQARIKIQTTISQRDLDIER